MNKDFDFKKGLKVTISKSTAWTLIAGSLIFFTASFSPLSRVHMESSVEGKMAIIAQSPTAWVLVQVLYGAGALLTAVGISSSAYQLRRYSRFALWASVLAAIVVGSLFFAAYIVFRTVNPHDWAQITPPATTFFVYTLLTQAGLFLFGLVLLSSPAPRWLAWLFLVGVGSLFVLTMIFRDMPPFFYYLLSLSAGIVFLRRAAADTRNSEVKQVSGQVL